MTMRALRVLVAGTTFWLATTPLAAQVVADPSPRGWLGVSFEMRTTRDGNTVRSVTEVTDVMPGSPAAEAGVRPGDVLVSFNGKNWIGEFGTITRSLRPGDPVRLVVARNGRLQEIRVTAGARPSEAVTMPMVSLTVTSDSIVERLFLAMDSLRVRITENRPVRVGDVRVTRDSADLGTVVHMRRSAPHADVVVAPFDLPMPGAAPGWLAPEVRPPFGFYLFRNPESDSLAEEMNELNEAVRGLRTLQASRTRQLSAERSRVGRVVGGDPELTRIDEELVRLGARADELRRAMEDVAQRRDEDASAFVWESFGEREGAVTLLRPLAPYLLGQNRVAGAEVVDLGPELAEYFQVEGGILVVNVPDGTPASEAGIQPGDVLTHMDGSPLRSIEDFRRGLVRAAPELPVTLVRKGRTLQVLLKR